MALFPRHISNGWDIFPEWERLQDEINSWFAGHFPGVEQTYPALNVYGNDDELVVTGELPGVSPEDLEISVMDTTLTLTMKRPELSLAEGETLHRQERGTGRFTRTLVLPFKVDRDGIEARLNKGILQVRLPRVAQEKPRKINVVTE